MAAPAHGESRGTRALLGAQGQIRGCTWFLGSLRRQLSGSATGSQASLYFSSRCGATVVHLSPTNSKFRPTQRPGQRYQHALHTRASQATNASGKGLEGQGTGGGEPGLPWPGIGWEALFSPGSFFPSGRARAGQPQALTALGFGGGVPHPAVLRGSSCSRVYMVLGIGSRVVATQGKCPRPHTLSTPKFF